MNMIISKLLIIVTFLIFASSNAIAGSNKVGVLLLAHGGKHASWDESVNNATAKLSQNYIVEVAFGMADPKRMQTGIDNLESQGVAKIVVVPLFISSYSPIIRQNEYLLGIRDTLADPPMLMSHYSKADTYAMNSTEHESAPKVSSHHKSNDTAPIKLEQLKLSTELILTKPLDAHPLVAEILFERISELSVNPQVETVLIVAHGPSAEEDNQDWLRAIDELTDQLVILQANKSGDFKEIYGMTVRDDAKTEIYDEAKEKLRAKVSESSVGGNTIVIPLLLSQGGVEARYLERLEGLTFKWSGKTLLPHPNITEFIQLSVDTALSN